MFVSYTDHPYTVDVFNVDVVHGQTETTHQLISSAANSRFDPHRKWLTVTVSYMLETRHTIIHFWWWNVEASEQEWHDILVCSALPDCWLTEYVFLFVFVYTVCVILHFEERCRIRLTISHQSWYNMDISSVMMCTYLG